MAYIDCPECGARALSVATRCPRCDHSFIQDRALDPEEPREPRRHTGALVVGAFAVLALVSWLLKGYSGNGPVPNGLAMDPPPAESAIVIVTDSGGAEADSAAPAASAAESDTVPGVVYDTARPLIARLPGREATAEPPSVTPEPAAAPNRQSTQPRQDSTSSQPQSTGGSVRLYTSTWVNVRSERSGGSSPVTVLNPGQEVGADSLSRGWYRVWLDGTPIGYVDRSFLDSAPPDSP